MMETKKRLTFPGHFDWDANETTDSFVCTIEYELFDPTSLDVRLMLLGDEERVRQSYNKLISLKYNHLRLHSNRRGIPSVEVLGIRGVGGKLWEAEINASAVEMGIVDASLKNGCECWALAQLMPSGILSDQSMREFLPTGEIKKSGGWEGSVEVTTPLGTLCAEEITRRDETCQYGDRVIHLVERVVIRGGIATYGGKSLREIHESLVTELDDICLMLSLCYRQGVRYYDISYDILDKAGEQREFQEASLRVKQHACTERRKRSDELIHFRDLVSGGLERLVRAFQNTVNRDALRRGITFLAASSDPHTVESCYFFAYSALESVLSSVDGSTPVLLSASQWKKLEKYLREHLDLYSEERGLTDVAMMKDKLPELRRTPAVQHIEKVCRRLGVKTDDLWTRHGFAGGVERATNLRNDLFHSALCKDARDLNGHLIRLRVLTERIILKILKWPDESIWVHHDQMVKWANIGSADSRDQSEGNPGSGIATTERTSSPSAANP